MNNIPFIIGAIIIIIYMISSIRRDKLSVSASFAWIIFCVILLFLAIFPYSLDSLSASLGISYPPALFLTICAAVLFVINFNDNKRIDELEKKVNDMSQEINILRSEEDEKNN